MNWFLEDRYPVRFAERGQVAHRPPTVDANAHMPCRTHAVPMLCSTVVLGSHFQYYVVEAWHGRGMVCVNETRPHCVNQMGKIQYKLLVTRHGKGTARYV
jgi:hypothetical protein